MSFNACGDYSGRIFGLSLSCTLASINRSSSGVGQMRLSHMTETKIKIWQPGVGSSCPTVEYRWWFSRPLLVRRWMCFVLWMWMCPAVPNSPPCWVYHGHNTPAVQTATCWTHTHINAEPNPIICLEISFQLRSAYLSSSVSVRPGWTGLAEVPPHRRNFPLLMRSSSQPLLSLKDKHQNQHGGDASRSKPAVGEKSFVQSVQPTWT